MTSLAVQKLQLELEKISEFNSKAEVRSGVDAKNPVLMNKHDPNLLFASTVLTAY